MYTLIEDFEDDARSVSSEDFDTGATDVVDDDDDDELLSAEDMADNDDAESDASGDLVDEALDADSW